jgi:hypothetical protein
MPTTLQRCFTKRKKYSLVLNDWLGHHGLMTEHTTTQSTSTSTSRHGRLRTFLKYAWGDSVAAHRAMLRVPPYDDYLINHRSER